MASSLRRGRSHPGPSDVESSLEHRADGSAFHLVQSSPGFVFSRPYFESRRAPGEALRQSPGDRALK